MSQAIDESPAPPSEAEIPQVAAPPPILDPYLVPPPPASRPRVSLRAVGAFLAPFVLGPLGALVAIAVGWAARHEIASDRENLRGFRLATAGMVLGFLSMLGWSGGAAVWAWRFLERSSEAALSAPPPPVKEGPSIVIVEPPSDPPAAPDPPGGAASPPDQEKSTGSVPQETTAKVVGGLTVVDVGVSAKSLADELKRQLGLAKAAKQTMLVMTTRNVCGPCRGVDRSLADPLMQAALGDVRLVRVDVDVFAKDLDKLSMPRHVFPSFFLLAPDLWIRDAIDGGEWGDDIAANIAPVLGPFVRGTYDKRVNPWHEPAGAGISL